MNNSFEKFWLDIEKQVSKRDENDICRFIVERFTRDIHSPVAEIDRSKYNNERFKIIDHCLEAYSYCICEGVFSPSEYNFCNNDIEKFASSKFIVVDEK